MPKKSRTVKDKNEGCSQVSVQVIIGWWTPDPQRAKPNHEVHVRGTVRWAKGRRQEATSSVFPMQEEACPWLLLPLLGPCQEQLPRGTGHELGEAPHSSARDFTVIAFPLGTMGSRAAGR